MAPPRLLIIAPNGPLPAWSLSTFTSTASASADEALALLKRDPFDAVVIAVAGEAPGLAELCARIHAMHHDNATPLVLAARGDDEAATRSLEALPFDAFVDLAWDSRLAERCLAASLQHVSAGRNMVQIQQQILRAARGEVSTLQGLALRDDLTGLYNVRHFREVSAKEHERCRRHLRPYAVVFIDLDNLKELNSAHGHAAGARAISRVGTALAALTRSSDYSFRIGGDEFVSLLVESSKKQALIYADRVRTAIAASTFHEGQDEIRLTLCAGVAGFPDDGATSEQVLEHADQALFQAKARGRNRVVLYGDPGPEVAR